MSPSSRKAGRSLHKFCSSIESCVWRTSHPHPLRCTRSFTRIHVPGCQAALLPNILLLCSQASCAPRVFLVCTVSCDSTVFFLCTRSSSPLGRVLFAGQILLAHYDDLSAFLGSPTFLAKLIVPALCFLVGAAASMCSHLFKLFPFSSTQRTGQKQKKLQR